MLAEVANPPAAIDRLLADWQRETDLKGSAILAATTVDVNELNSKAQALQRELGRLGDSPVQVGRDTLFAGDRVLFLRNSLTLGVCNGDLGIVRDVQGQTLLVKLDDARSVTVDVQAYPHVRLGYALTTHKAQGMTVENSFILTGGSMTDREVTYVQASRARGATRWYVGYDLEDVTQRMTRSHEKITAFSLAEGPELELTIAR